MACHQVGSQGLEIVGHRAVAGQRILGRLGGAGDGVARAAAPIENVGVLE